MSQTVITTAFEQWKAQQAADGQAIVLDEFVFANVPNLDVNAPIDRTAGMPPAAQIVHRQTVEKTGLVNQNAVVYSVTLGADVGDFSFNWIGLVNKSNATLAMVVYAPLQSKVKNAHGQQGNVLTRSFLMEYNGAESQTLISTPAETWQIDFTARMAGMDEALRLANLDIYGAGAFFENGFLVSKTGNQYFVTAGVGYIGGLRASLASNVNVTVTAKPITVWADVNYSGTLTSAYQTEIKFTLATALADYEQSGIKHYVFALASIDANGAITDLRPKGTSLYLRKDKNLTDIADRAAALETLNGVPKTRKVNDKNLSADIDLDADDVGALPAGGTAVAATKLETARKIAGVTFDGTKDISITPENVGALASGGTAVAATKLETARKIAGVAFDGTKDIAITPENVGALASGGTAVAATKLETARKIAGVAFDGTKDINITSSNVGLGNVGNFAAVQQGGGVGMQSNKVYIGWTGSKVKIQVDASDMGEVYTTNFPPPQQDLSGYAHRDWITYVGLEADNPNAPYMRRASNNALVYLATSGWSDSRFIYDVQRGSQALENAGWTAQQNWEAPTGCFMTGLNIRPDMGDCRMMGKYYRALMVRTASGSWRQVGN